MPQWCRLEKRQVTEMREGAIYKTKIVGSEWFEVGKAPEPYKLVDGNMMYVATLDYVIAPTKPS